MNSIINPNRRGETGSQGLQGIQGVSGPQGIQGTPGTTGPIGPTGPTGATGAVGATGPAGANATQIQSIRATTDAAGLYTWTYSTPYGVGVIPHIYALAQGPDPVAGVLVNAQVEGIPTNTSCKIRVTKTNASVVALLGLTIKHSSFDRRNIHHNFCESTVRPP